MRREDVFLAQWLEKEKEKFSRACRILYEKGLVSGVGGNLCVRAGEIYLLTPTGYSLRDIETDNISVVDENMKLIEGQPPTKDALVHMEVLKKRTDVAISCHVHGAYIIAAGSLLYPGDNSIPPITPGFVYFAYPLPMLPFLVPGSNELKTSVVEILSKGEIKALLLQNHGLITLGESYSEAINIAEEVEEAAHIYLLTHGKARHLTDSEIEKIKSL